MGDRYLTDLADVVRRAGLAVIEMDGWQSRARGSGGYNPGCPDHVMVHHTASPPSSDGWPDANYCTYNDDDAPLCNLYLNRSGTVWICAAGATNTNGSGHDPCGWCPDDSLNSHAIGIEAGSTGTGETWPDVQCDAYLALVDALCTGYAIPTGRVHSHQEYASTRKTDPAGPDRWATGSASWNMAEFRSDLLDVPPPRPPTPTPIREDDTVLYAAQSKDTGQYWIGDGIHRRRITADWSADFWQFAEWGVGPVVIPFASDPRADPPPARVRTNADFTDCAESTLIFLGEVVE